MTRSWEHGNRSRLQLRRDTEADWLADDPVLAYGEPGWDETNRVLKIGDGVTPWSALAAVTGDFVAKAGDTMTGTLLLDNAGIAVNDDSGGANHYIEVYWQPGDIVSQMGGAGVDVYRSDTDGNGAYMSSYAVGAYSAGSDPTFFEISPGYLQMGALYDSPTYEMVVIRGGLKTQNVTWTRSGTTITFTCPVFHNLAVGNTLTISASSSTAALTNGSKTVVTAATLTTFTVTGLNAGDASGTATYVMVFPSHGSLLRIMQDGKVVFGPTPSGPVGDTNLYRSAPNVLRTDDEFQAGEDIRAGEVTKNGTDGLILYSPDGTAYRVTVNNGGTLSVSAA